MSEGLVKVGVIGGSGLLSSEAFASADSLEYATPFGAVQYKRICDSTLGLDIVFVQRHATSHLREYDPPHLVNHRAIWYTFKHLHVSFVFAMCSVGSLKKHIPVGTIVIPDDYFCPWEIQCMSDEKTAHHAPVINESVRALLIDSAKHVVGEFNGVGLVTEGVYVNTKGPRFETKAEIRFMAAYADVVGMTGAHEATLSAEYGIPYAMLCVVDNMANGLADKLTLEAFHEAQRANKRLVESCLATVLSYIGNKREGEKATKYPELQRHVSVPESGDYDVVIHAKYVVLVDAKDRIIEDGAVGVKDGMIKKIGKSKAADTSWNVAGAQVVRRPNGILMPGLINAHTHAAMVYLRGSADDMRLTRWLTEKIWPAEGAVVSEKMIADATVLAIAEMILGGTTCFNDMYFFPEAVSEVVQRVGMRGFSGAIVIEFPSPYGSGPDEYLQKGEALISGLSGEDRLHFTVSPHSPYAVSEEHLVEAHKLAKKYGVPFHIHMHETVQEITDSVEGNATQFKHNSAHNCRPLANFKRLGLIDKSLIAVHMTQVTDEEIKDFAALGANVVHCPASNLKLASGFCPVGKLVEAGVNVAIGTDGAASNNSLDMFSEMRLASLLAKGVGHDAEAIPAATAIRMATINGAKALGVSDKLGSIEVGKYADLITVDCGNINMLPMYNVISHLVYVCERSNVTDVWIQGRRVLDERRLCTINLEKTKEAIGEYYEKVRSALNH